MRIFITMMALLLSTAILAEDRYQVFTQERLQQGRPIWLKYCEGCHGWGIADAPVPMRPEEWQARLSQTQETLYAHAINGFFGPDDSMMPPRGGADHLSDEQVKLAVDYMTELAKFHINKSKSNPYIKESQHDSRSKTSRP